MNYYKYLLLLQNCSLVSLASEDWFATSCTLIVALDHLLPVSNAMQLHPHVDLHSMIRTDVKISVYFLRNQLL